MQYTHVILFTPQPTTRVNSISPSSIHRLSSILRGTLAPNKARGDRYALLWRQWSSDSTQLRYIDIPTSSPLDLLIMCIRGCIWEQDEDTPPPPLPLRLRVKAPIWRLSSSGRAHHRTAEVKSGKVRASNSSASRTAHLASSRKHCCAPTPTFPTSVEDSSAAQPNRDEPPVFAVLLCAGHHRVTRGRHQSMVLRR